jgi:hypothetical protein
LKATGWRYNLDHPIVRIDPSVEAGGMVYAVSSDRPLLLLIAGATKPRDPKGTSSRRIRERAGLVISVALDAQVFPLTCAAPAWA